MLSLRELQQKALQRKALIESLEKRNDGAALILKDRGEALAWAHNLLSAPEKLRDIRSLREYGKARMIYALSFVNWKPLRAGEALGMCKSSLYRKMKQYDLTRLI